jgi:nucleotide-binding universal stress UspA family protein
MWSYPPHKILVPVDFGDASGRALRVARLIAEAHHATLAALHAETLEAPAYFTRSQVRALERQRDAARGEAARFLATFVARHQKGDVETMVVEGSPAASIAQAARRADLVVMGTHGRRGPARWWAGSVAERVVRDADVPVMVVRSGTPSTAALFRQIVVVESSDAFDGAARRYARGLAEMFEGAASPDPVSPLDTAALHEATLLVFAKSPARTFTAFVAGAEHLLRTCRRPALFVPPM